MPVDHSRQNTQPSDPRPVVLFDGDCGLCDRWVQFVLKADSAERFRFAPLQVQEMAQADSVMLRVDGRVYLRSEAVLRTLGQLGFPYRVSLVLRWIPLRLRDAVYDLVARHRHRWLSPRAVCSIPTARQIARSQPLL
jgi:predicted DCC family thiol-disulfide oxidoreductase YuxK